MNNEITRDFTEARRLREAQLAIQVRDDFLAIAGHELKTPLAVLLMYVEGLERSLRADNASPRLRQRLDKAAAAGRRLEKLIDELLDVSRISGGRLPLGLGIGYQPADVGQYLVGERIQRRRPVQPDQRHPPHGLEQDLGLGHELGLQSFLARRPL